MEEGKMGKIKMIFKKEEKSVNMHDIRMFYTLKSHYNCNCLNIGVIGNKKKLDKVVKTAYNTFKKKKPKLIYSESKKRYILIVEEQETQYIQIETIDDLENRIFCRFL